jgi:hypothetical protein
VRAALILCVLLGACLEVVDHTPPGACGRDDECPCGQDCSVADAGLHFCGARVTHSCTDDHDCTSTGRPPHCIELSRDGGGCGYLVCQ